LPLLGSGKIDYVELAKIAREKMARSARPEE